MTFRPALPLHGLRDADNSLILRETVGAALSLWIVARRDDGRLVSGSQALKAEALDFRLRRGGATEFSASYASQTHRAHDP